MLVSFLAAAAVAQQPAVEQDLRRNRLDQRPRTTAPAGRTRGGTAAVESQGVAQPISEIRFEGAEAPSAVAEAARGFIGRPATRETLTELAGALSKAYERTNVALFTVSIADQDLGNGVVTVSLTEGWVESTTIAGGPNAFPLLRKRAQRLVGQRPLSRGRLERQTALMQSIPGLTFDSSFENPEGDASVIVSITPRQERVQGAVGINNRGPSLLGDLVLNAGVDAYKLLTDGDQLSFTAGATPNPKRYRLLETAYSLPIGASGLNLSGSLGFLRTKAHDLDVRGRAKLAAVTLTYPLIRRADQAADVSFAIDGINSNNAAFGNVIATERTRAARLAGTFVDADDTHDLTLGGTLSRGLDIFDARTTLDLADVTFTKFNATGTYEHQLAPRLLGRAHAQAQFTGDALPAAELLSIGGATLGRAFDTGILTGDTGHGGFLELAYRPISAENFAQSEIYGFADAARLKVRRRDVFPEQKFDLASAGVGVRARYKDRIQLGVEGAAVLDKPFAGYTKDRRLSFFYSILF